MRFTFIPSAEVIGNWFISKYRLQAAKTGVQSTARAMRKQGIPIEVALAVLCAPAGAQLGPGMTSPAQDQARAAAQDQARRDAANDHAAAPGDDAEAPVGGEHLQRLGLGAECAAVGDERAGHLAVVITIDLTGVAVLAGHVVERIEQLGGGGLGTGGGIIHVERTSIKTDDPLLRATACGTN